MNRPGRSRTAVLTSAAVVAGLVLMPGCNKHPELREKAKPTDPKTDPWDTAAKRLRKETDPAACKAALGQLNTDLAHRKDIPGPVPLSDDGMKALAALVPLSAEDREEVRRGAYSGLDPVYLADCLYLRDAARSLDPTGLPPADLARVGFAWACRQVYLHPWVVEGFGPCPAVPPTYVLRRGHGAGLERAYVFLALLQQMGIDGCLIGPPDAATRPAGFAPNGPDGKPAAGPPKGPFWAVGARVGADILLFEPWRGEPFPGPDGKGVGALAQVKANPGQVKAWLGDKTWGLTADDLKSGAVFLAVPVSGLSPRMALLDEKLKADTGTKLAVNPAALRDRFTTAAPAGPGLPAEGVKFWNPPGDRFAYGRVTATFLPPEEGGTDRADESLRMYTRYRFDLIPRSVFAVPPELTAAPAVERLRVVCATVYETSFFTPPSPRERIQRGQFQDAARDLTAKQESFGRGLERLRTENPAEIGTWCATANQLYDALNRARYPNIGQTTPQPDSDPQVAEARGKVEDFWRSTLAMTQVIVDRATAVVGRAEAGFLLALVKHEEAERQQLRADRAAGADAPRAKAAAAGAWREAANAWESFLEQPTNEAAFPGRKAHARDLSARAKKLAGEK